MIVICQEKRKGFFATLKDCPYFEETTRALRKPDPNLVKLCQKCKM